MKTKSKTREETCQCPECGASNTLRHPDGTICCLACGAETDPSAYTGPLTAMSDKMGDLLVKSVVPRLKGLVRSIPKVGHEDDEEIVQDTTLMAARLMIASTRAGHPITAGNASYYAAKGARGGRRSHYTGRSDVMSPGCQFDGKAKHVWLDDEIEFEPGEVGTLHDAITSYEYQGQETDPAEEAARNLDWESFLASHSSRHRIAITVLVEGGTMREAGKRCGIKDGAAAALKKRIATDLVEFFGEDVIRRLLDGIRPNWESNLRVSRERTHQSHQGAFQPLAQPVG